MNLEIQTESSGVEGVLATDKLRMMHSRFKGTDSDRLRQRSLIAIKKGTHRLTVVPFLV